MALDAHHLPPLFLSPLSTRDPAAFGSLSSRPLSSLFLLPSLSLARFLLDAIAVEDLSALDLLVYRVNGGNNSFGDNDTVAVRR